MEQEHSGKLETVRMALWDLKEADQGKNPGERDPHLDVIDPDLLSEGEAVLWEEAQDIESPADMRSFQESLKSYREEFRSEMAGEMEDRVREHRKAMLGLIQNRAQAAMGRLLGEAAQANGAAEPEKAAAADEAGIGSGPEEEKDADDDLEELLDDESDET
jgi:hypothetical protein